MTALLLLLLLGAEPNEPATRIVGPVLTEEKCFVYDVNPRFGRKVCMVEQSAYCEDKDGTRYAPFLCGRMPVLNRWCWCAEQESK